MTVKTKSFARGRILESKPYSPKLLRAPDYDSDTTESVSSGRLIEELRAGQGVFELYEMPDGRYAFDAKDRLSAEALRRMLAQTAFSDLEIYLTLGGDLSKAPRPFRNGHLVRFRESARADKPAVAELSWFLSEDQLPNVMSTGNALYIGDLKADVTFTELDFSEDVVRQLWFDQFRNWWLWGNFYDGPYYVGDISLNNFGASGIDEFGLWDDGDADINLPSTSMGAVAMCFPTRRNAAPIDWIRFAEVIVEERLSPNLWFKIHEWTMFDPDRAYGFWFRGTLMRRFRVKIRSPDDAFLWGGVY